MVIIISLSIGVICDSIRRFVDYQSHDNYDSAFSSSPKIVYGVLKYYYSLLSTPRNNFNKNSSSGGGTAFLIREPFTQLPTSVPDFSSFESSSVTLQLSHSKLSVFNIYRPPSSSTHSKPFSLFLDDFSSFLSSAASTPHEFIITGD